MPIKACFQVDRETRYPDEERGQSKPRISGMYTVSRSWPNKLRHQLASRIMFKSEVHLDTISINGCMTVSRACPDSLEIGKHALELKRSLRQASQHCVERVNPGD